MLSVSSIPSLHHGKQLLERNSSVADSVLTFDDGSTAEMVSPVWSPGGSEACSYDDDEVIDAARAAAAAAAFTAQQERPVMMRMASVSNGEGFEVADMLEDEPSSPTKDAMMKLDSIENARMYRSMLSDSQSKISVDQSFKSMPLDDFMMTSMFRRTMSDDGMYGGEYSMPCVLFCAQYICNRFSHMTMRFHLWHSRYGL